MTDMFGPNPAPPMPKEVHNLSETAAVTSDWDLLEEQIILIGRYYDHLKTKRLMNQAWLNENPNDRPAKFEALALNIRLTTAMGKLGICLDVLNLEV